MRQGPLQVQEGLGPSLMKHISPCFDVLTLQRRLCHVKAGARNDSRVGRQMKRYRCNKDPGGS